MSWGKGSPLSQVTREQETESRVASTHKVAGEEALIFSQAQLIDHLKMCLGKGRQKLVVES